MQHLDCSSSSSRICCRSDCGGGRLASAASKLASCFPGDFDANTRMVMLFAITANSIRNVWDQNIMSSFIYLLSDRSSYVVGFLTGTTGLVQALMAPVMGFFADKYPRVTVLWSSGIIGIVGILLTIPSVIYGHLVFIFLSMAIWGLFWASVNPTLDAVLADSVGQGQRSRVYSWRYSMLILGTAVGPFVTLLIFSSLGDHWSVPECQVVIGTGLGLFLAPVSILFLFQPLNTPNGHSDYAALPAISTDDSASSSSGSSIASTAISGPQEEDTAIDVSVRGEPLTSTESLEGSNSALHVTKVLRASHKQAEMEMLSDIDAEQSRYLTLVVPATIALGDIITGLASGMTIKFFPIFFMNDLHMKPVALSMLYTLTPLCTAASGVAAQRFSLRFGRGTATICFKLVGLSFMAALCYFAYHKYDAKFIIPVYIVRTALMNSSKPLTKSIIMDLVPANQRVRWAALESINNATWSGSAVLGGILIDKYGIIANFVVTLILQLISTLPLLLVSGAIPSEKPHATFAAASSNADRLGAPMMEKDVELAVKTTTSSPEVVREAPSRDVNEWQRYDDGLEDDLEMLHAAAGAMGADDDEESLVNKSDDVFWEDTSR